MHDSSNDEQKRIARRSFFRQLTLQGLDAAEASLRRAAAPANAGSDDAQAPTAAPLRILRPPGAAAEDDFASACSRCGACVDACPAQCIELHPTRGGGLPHIIARQSPCVICDDLSCMKACPTGALTLVDRLEINMGTAVIDHERCLRTQPAGDDCTVCVSQCPIGESALAVNEDGTLEVRPGCTGCGVCERVCPTEPASIVVEGEDAGAA